MFSIIQLSLYDDFRELEQNKKIQNVSGCHFSNLKNDTTYYWRVKTVNEYDGNESEWSNTCTFRTIVESIVIIINNDIDILYELDSIEILPKICEVYETDLKKNRCNPELETPVESELGTCLSENKFLTNCV